MTYSMEPTVISSQYVPDQLIAGNYPLVTDTVTLAAGLNLARGSLLGQATLGTPTAVAGANTGNGTCSAVTDQANAQIGAYQVKFTAATTFVVERPDGSQLLNGVTGTAYADEIGFTITAGGTAFVAGDSFTITVPAGTGYYELATSSAVDGSANYNAWAVLAEDTNTSSTGTNAATTCPVYIAGEFDANYMTFGSGITAASAKPQVRDANIYIKIGALSNTPV